MISQLAMDILAPFSAVTAVAEHRTSDWYLPPDARDDLMRRVNSRALDYYEEIVAHVQKEGSTRRTRELAAYADGMKKRVREYANTCFLYARLVSARRRREPRAERKEVMWSDVKESEGTGARRARHLQGVRQADSRVT